jgi:hypothetical protein
VVNVAVLVLRRDRVEHKHFKAPTIIPVVGAITCAYLASPLSGRAGADYRVAGVLLVIGVVLWAITYATNKFILHQDTTIDPAKIER